MKKITKKDAKIFNEGFIKGIIELGAKETKRDEYKIHFDLQTIAGLLSITMYFDQAICYTVFSRFEEEKMAKELFDCNPYSGKYNFSGASEGGAKENLENALAMFWATVPEIGTPECHTKN